MSFDTTPVDEKCEQVPYQDGGVKARKEAIAFIRQLKREFGECPGTSYKIQSNPHDGWEPGQVFYYLSVEVFFDDSDPAATEYVYNIERQLPSDWDEQARIELGLPLD
jgi:hypothetical protein